MATTVKIRRSGTATATPSSLEHGEIAINYADGKVFWKDASNVITSFTFQSYALASHTHAASDITSGTLDIARIPTGSTSSTVCIGDDARLSDTRTPTDGTVSTAKLADAAVTYAKIQNVSTTDRLLGRSTAGAGVVEEITCTAFGRSLIDDADAATARTTLGVQPTASPAFTGSMSLINSGASDNSTIRYGNSGQDWYVGLRGDTSNAFAIADSVAFRLTISSTGTATFAGQIVGQAGAAISGGAVTVTSPLVLTGTVAGNNRMIEYQTEGTTRWRVTPSFGAETGSNTGSDFLISKFNDAGSFTGSPLQIRRDTGRITAENGLTSQDQLIVTAGSVSACSVAPTGDPNTGLVFPAANVAAIVTDGTERVRVDASGYVIIPKSGSGTTGPELVLRNTASINTSNACRIAFLTDSGASVGGTPNGAIDSVNTGGGGASSMVFSTWNGSAFAARLTIGNAGSLTALQVYSDTVGATNRDLYIDDTGKFGYVSSIRESKTDIVTLDDVSWLSALTPVSYRYRKQDADGTYTDEADGVTDYGLIAEDVEAVRPELCFYDNVDGTPELRGVTYSKLITPMLRYIQQLEARIAALEERLSNA